VCEHRHAAHPKIIENVVTFHDVSVLCIRQGAVVVENRPTLSVHYPGYLNQRACTDMIDRCLQAPGRPQIRRVRFSKSAW